MRLGSFSKLCGKIGVWIVAGVVLSSCGSSNILPPSNTEPTDDVVAASARTRMEFERYWAPYRQNQPRWESQNYAAADAQAYQPASSAPQRVVSEPVEYEDDSEIVYAASPSPQSTPQPTYQSEPQVASGGGYKPFWKSAEPVTTWWLNGNPAAYKRINGGSSFPTGKPAGKYVQSPYNGQYVDVKDLSSGTLVADPRYDVSEMKYFIIP